MNMRLKKSLSNHDDINFCAPQVGFKNGDDNTEDAYPQAEQPVLTVSPCENIRLVTLNDVLALLAQAVDAQADNITRFQENRWLEPHPDARRRTGRDHVARL